MIKIKKPLINPINNGQMKIRQLSEKDLEFYRNWYSKHFSEDFISSLPMDQIDRMISKELALNITLILEYAGKPFGEINIINDKSIIFADKNIKKPIYSFSIIMHENCLEYNSKDLINLFIKQLKESKLKISTLYVFIDDYIGSINKSFTDNGFIIISKESFSSKLEKVFIKKNIDNPYKSKDIYAIPL